MKKIIRTRTITKISRRLIVCHENLATGESHEQTPIECPHCGELIYPPQTLTLEARQAEIKPELPIAFLDQEAKEITE
jgi:hypothetical protein